MKEPGAVLAMVVVIALAVFGYFCLRDLETECNANGGILLRGAVGFVCVKNMERVK